MAKSENYWISEHDGIQKEMLLIFNEYLLSLKLENKAKATITKYRSILERFLSEFTIPLEEITSKNILEWLTAYSIDKKPRTIDLVLSSLSSFFTFCLEEDYMDEVVMKKRWRPTIPQSLPQFLDEYDYARVRLAIEKLSIRDRALVLFLFSSGCRRSEVSNLNKVDVDLKKRTAEVTGKGNKKRTVHFSEECSFILKTYLDTRKDQESEYMFINKFGNRLGTQGIYKVTTKVGTQAGLRRALNPHSCRHTFATRMLAKGATLEFIADELGHADLNTTRVYARIPTEDMITAYQNMMG